MGCCGAKEDDQGVSFVAGQMEDGAVASVATIMPTPEQPLAKRAEGLAALPEHLRLGITLPGMRKLLSELPDDAVEQVNAKIPLDKDTGEPKFPVNVAMNGYTSQFWMTLAAKEAKEGQPEGDGLAVCERLQKQGG